jgi:hypothetical protein
MTASKIFFRARKVDFKILFPRRLGGGNPRWIACANRICRSGWFGLTASRCSCTKQERSKVLPAPAGIEIRYAERVQDLGPGASPFATWQRARLLGGPQVLECLRKTRRDKKEAGGAVWFFSLRVFSSQKLAAMLHASHSIAVRTNFLREGAKAQRRDVEKGALYVVPSCLRAFSWRLAPAAPGVARRLLPRTR